MSKFDLALGDTVQLKSGGPEMTVTNLAPYGGGIQCMWFAGKKRESGSFPPEALKRLERKPDAA